MPVRVRLVLPLLAAMLIALSPFAAGLASAERTLTGTLPLTGGSGLVVWGGGPVHDIAGAADARGCAPSSVWLSIEGRFTGYIFGAPAVANAPFAAAYPSAVLPAGTALVLLCAMPVSEVIFDSALSDRDRGLVLAQVRRAEAFIGAEMGARFEGVTIHVATSYDDYETRAVAERFRAGARSAWFRTKPSGFGGSAIGSFVVAITNNWSEGQSLITHELFHVAQTRVGRKTAGVPTWLGEGGATYAEAAHVDAIAGERRPQLERLRLGLQLVPTPIGQLDKPCYGEPGERLACSRDPYTVGQAGLAWLLERNPASAHADFWRRKGAGRDVEASFAGVFGMTLADFYQRFEEYRRGLGTAPGIQVRLTAGGGPADSWSVFAIAICATTGACPNGAQVSRYLGDSTFMIATPPGRYLLGARSPSGCARHYLTANGTGTLAQTAAAELEFAQAIVAREFAVAADPPCGSLELSLTVGGSTGGAPWRLGACAGATTAECYSGLLGPTGTVRLSVPVGAYTVYAQSASGCRLQWRTASGGTVTQASATTVSVTASSAERISVSLPSIPPCTGG